MGDKKLITMMVVLVVVGFISTGIIFSIALSEIDSAGGVRSIIVDAGKGIKSISKEINETK